MNGAEYHGFQTGGPRRLLAQLVDLAQKRDHHKPADHYRKETNPSNKEKKIKKNNKKKIYIYKYKVKNEKNNIKNKPTSQKTHR